MIDITEHKWTSLGIIRARPIADGDLEFDTETDPFWINKSDAIAIARHFLSAGEFYLLYAAACREREGGGVPHGITEVSGGVQK